MLLRISLCLLKYYKKGKIDFLFLFVVSIFYNMGVLLEDPSRGEDYTVFVCPNLLRGLWALVKKSLGVNDIPFAKNIIFGVGMGLLGYLKVYHGSDMPASYNRQVSFLLGLNNNDSEKESNKNNSKDSDKNNSKDSEKEIKS